MRDVPEVRLVVENVHVDGSSPCFAVLFAKRFDPALDELGWRGDAGRCGRAGCERRSIGPMTVADVGAFWIVRLLWTELGAGERRRGPVLGDPADHGHHHRVIEGVSRSLFEPGEDAL